MQMGAGQPRADIALRARNWVWYCLVQQESLLSDDDLDRVFVQLADQDRKRPRTFARIRNMGSAPTDVRGYRRKTSVYAAVHSEENRRAGHFEHARRAFESPLWELLTVPDLSPDRIQRIIGSIVTARGLTRVDSRELGDLQAIVNDSDLVKAIGLSIKDTDCLTDVYLPQDLDAVAVLAALYRESLAAHELRRAVLLQDAIREEMVRTRPGDRLTPIIPLVLRHASGRLFQEAHYLVELDPQQSLFGAPEAKTVGRDSTLGAFFTPSPLVRTVVEEALKAQPVLPADVTVLDPACGSGEFLREALRQLQLRGHAGRVKLVGWDISPAALSMAQFALGWERSQSGLNVELELEERDALSLDAWNTGASLILMNPPFISWQGMNEGQRERVAERLGALSSKRPDYASVFFFNATNALVDNGVIGAVLPASLLDGESYVDLRQAIASVVKPHLIARLGSHTVFADAMVDAALYVGVHGQIDRPPLAVWSNHKADSSARALRRLRSISPMQVPSYAFDGGDYSVYAAEHLGRDGASWAPRPYAAYHLLKEVGHLPKTGSLFDVSQGTITGLNSVFLVPREYVEALPKVERKYFRPAVVNNSITNGVLNDNTYVFYPHGKGLEIDSEDALLKKLKVFSADRLVPNKTALRKRSATKSDKWWALTRPRQKLDAKGPKLISTYFGGAGSFAWDPDGRYVPIQGYGWTPKSNTVAGCEAAYLALLNHPLIDTLLSGVSNNLSGGQWNLSERYVNHLPLPKFRASDKITESLTVIGNALAQGMPVDRDIWNRSVGAAFGLKRKV